MKMAAAGILTLARDEGGRRLFRPDVVVPAWRQSLTSLQSRIGLPMVLFDQHPVRVLQRQERKQRWTAMSSVAVDALRAYLDDF